MSLAFLHQILGFDRLRGRGEGSCRRKGTPSRRDSIPRPAATLSLILAAILLCTGMSLAAGPVVATSAHPSVVAPSLLSPSPRLGALLPLTGALGLYGTSMANAVGLLEEQVNASGGIRGTNFTALGGTVPIVILYLDSATDHTAELTSLFSTNPQAVFLAAYPYDGQIILQNWWANHAAWPTHWIFTDGMGDQTTMDSLRSNGVETGNFTGLALSRSPTPTGVDAYERYRSAYAARFGQEPTLLSENAYDAAFILALAMEAADSTDPTQFRSALRYVANPPGHTILPGQWAEALAALDAGENIDYWGAANRADFDRYGDVGTAFGVWLVDGAGVIRTVAVLDEPIFWTPAPEDPLPPHVAISSPTEGALLSGVSTIRGTANASLGIAAIQVHVDGGEWQNATANVTWTFDLNTTALSDGPHRIAARTFDGTHYSSEATIDVTVDNSPPSVVIRSPLGGAYVAASLAIANWSATDPVSGVERIEVQLDTSSPLVLPGTATNQSFANLAGGAHSLTVRAIDRAGNVGERSVAFIADASGPTTAFSIDGTQGDAFWFTSDVRITLAFVDSGSGVETTFIRVDQNPWQAYTPPLVLSADGVYNVSFS